jgi:aspartate carbamoyltransferase catalytic subunit
VTARHLIDFNNLSIQEWNELINLASNIQKNPLHYMHKCEGKILATLFYEPSTRTQMSFHSAMLRLGGQVIGFDNPVNSSVSKGESLKDTIRIVSGYSDILVIRNPLEGSAKAASLYSRCPVVNAGDGGHLHPSQTLTDIVTLSHEKGRLTDLKIGLCGDLKFGRTVHSLIKAMARYEGNSFYLISTPELALPNYIKDEIKGKYQEFNSLEGCIDQLDVLYMTRIQQERFASTLEYENQRSVYILDKQKLSKAKKDLAVLHPLPRLDEISNEVDDDPRALYFKQAEYGMYARMALIIRMIEDSSYSKVEELGEVKAETTCSNPKCITKSEKYLPHLRSSKNDSLSCEYCDGKM